MVNKRTKKRKGRKTEKWATITTTKTSASVDEVKSALKTLKRLFLATGIVAIIYILGYFILRLYWQDPLARLPKSYIIIRTIFGVAAFVAQIWSYAEIRSSGLWQDYLDKDTYVKTRRAAWVFLLSTFTFTTIMMAVPLLYLINFPTYVTSIVINLFPNVGSQVAKSVTTIITYLSSATLSAVLLVSIIGNLLTDLIKFIFRKSIQAVKKLGD